MANTADGAVSCEYTDHTDPRARLVCLPRSTFGVRKSIAQRPPQSRLSVTCAPNQNPTQQSARAYMVHVQRDSHISDHRLRNARFARSHRDRDFADPTVLAGQRSRNRRADLSGTKRFSTVRRLRPNFRASAAATGEIGVHDLPETLTRPVSDKTQPKVVRQPYSGTGAPPLPTYYQTL